MNNFSNEIFIGIDIGSVSLNLAVIDKNNILIYKDYIRTSGSPINATKKAFQNFLNKYNNISWNVLGVGTTGSGRHLIGYYIGADEIKNEITSHAIATMHFYDDVSTIIEIGGQDSKIIIIENKVVVDFAMNTICAAGTGSFLDQQAQRLGIDITLFGNYALKSNSPTKIAGRCGVFAESDMIHKQQIGYPKEDIILGLCYALANNYLNNVARGKKIKEKIIFQGGVAANVGMVKAFTEILKTEIFVPKYYDVMGAIGVALITKKSFENNKFKVSKFKGFNFLEGEVSTDLFTCQGCSNFCEIITLKKDFKKLFNIGGKCGKYDQNYELI